MDILIAIVIGGLIGWVASLVMKTDGQMGLIANVLVGIVGGFLGHWLAPKLGIGGGQVVYYAVSVAGAILLIVILKALKVFR